MSRTIGAKDKFRRKPRSDRNKHRKIYAGKPTKPKRKTNGKLVPYRTKRKRDAPIKVWFQEVRPISPEGYRKIPKRWRRIHDKKVKVWIGKPQKVDPQEISNAEQVGDIAIRILQYPGLFNLTMPTHSKNSWRVSYKKKAIVRITEGEEGLNAKVYDYSKLKHYWFFKEK